jgi:hypothetical protein
MVMGSGSGGGRSGAGAYGFHEGPVEKVENPGAVVIVENVPKEEEKEARGFKRMLLKGLIVDMVSSCEGEVAGGWGSPSSPLTMNAAPSPFTPTKL